MAATVRSSSTYASAATEASFSVPLPAGFAAGDVCYLFAEGRAASGAFGTAPAGWTAVAASFASGASTSSFMVCYRRVMQAGDANPTVTGTSGRYSAVAAAVQGADNGTPEDVAAVTDNGGASALTTITSPGLTPAASNDLLLTGFGCGTPATGTAINCSTPAGTSLVASIATTVAAVTESGMMVASRALSSNAATGTEQTSITPSAIDGQTVTVAVRAAAAGAAASPAQPGRTWLRRFHHRQQVFPPPPAAAASAATVAQRGAPVQARQLPGRGGRVISRVRAAPFTIVQAAPTVESPSLTTATVNLPHATTAGNTLVACITTSGGTVNPAVSGITLGGAADHWQAAVTDAGNVAFGGAVWFDPGCAAGQTSVVVTCAGGSGVNPEIYVAVYEVSGVLFFDKGSTGDAASGAAAWSSGATGTTAQSAEIFFGACSASTAVPAVTGAGIWTTQASAAGNFDQVSGFQIVTALGTATFSGTIPSGAYTALVATFTAVPPAAGAGPPVYPPHAPVQSRQLPLRGGSANRRSGVYDGTGPPVRAAQGPVRARVPQLARGGSVTARAGAFGGLGPALKALAQAVASKVRGLPPRGRTASRAGLYGQAGPPVRAAQGPVRSRQQPQRGGHAASRAGTFTAVILGSGPPVYPLGHPVQARRQPSRGGSTAARAGTYTAVVLTTGPPVYPLGHPVQARRQPLTGGRVIRRAGTYQQAGPPAVPLRQPVSARRPPPPPARGRAQSQRGPYGQAGPPVVRLRHPARGQPQKPLLTGRAAWRTGTYTAPIVPVFTIGALTATTAATATQAPSDKATAALTGGTAASSTLTAGDQRTGGPGG